VAASTAAPIVVSVTYSGSTIPSAIVFATAGAGEGTDEVQNAGHEDRVVGPEHAGGHGGRDGVRASVHPFANSNK